MPDEKDDENGGAANDGSVRALKGMSFALADVQNGMGPYVTVFLKSVAHWGPAQIGVALAAGNVAQVLAQAPTGGLIDGLKQKRELIVVGSVMILVACLGIAFFPVFPIVLTAQILIGVAGAIFPPCVAAITLGLVGRKRMDGQTGTNQAFNAAGNLTAALLIGLVGWFFGLRWMFGLIVLFCAAAAFFVLRIKADDIDFDLARGCDGPKGGSEEGAKKEEPPKGVVASLKAQFEGLKTVAKNRNVRVFLIASVIFHFANAAMVPLVTQLLSDKRGGREAVVYTAGYMMASQLVFLVAAAVCGRLAASLGRKPLFLFGFAALALRGFLYTVSHAAPWLIAIQCMDGLGAGIFGVVSVLIVADLTKGTGRFNLAQGAIASAVGVGAFLSNSVGGFVAKHAGVNAAFLMLGAIAAVGLVFFWRMMPETLEGKGAEGQRPVGAAA